MSFGADLAYFVGFLVNPILIPLLALIVLYTVVLAARDALLRVTST